jgi:GT2 family glycosyltransferase
VNSQISFESSVTPGVSIVVCTHNGAARLPATLAHLAAQKVSPDCPWEVVIIDNASTDGTSDIARRLWPSGHSAAFRVILEPRLGSARARERGLRAAKYEYVSFVDDDNWVCPEWVQTTAEVMSARPDVGACFGLKEPACETDPPSWFETFKWMFVIGPDPSSSPPDFTNRPCEVPSAGLCVCKSAWFGLERAGFRLLTVGRVGSRLTAGEDTELCCALTLSGWKILYDPRLRLKHFIPQSRLNWAYLRRQSRGWGISTALLDPYYFALRRAADPIDGRTRAPADIRETWLWHASAAGKNLLRRPMALVWSLFYEREGSRQQLEVDGMIGRLIGLLQTRSAHDRAVRDVLEARWLVESAQSRERYRSSVENFVNGRAARDEEAGVASPQVSQRPSVRVRS